MANETIPGMSQLMAQAQGIGQSSGLVIFWFIIGIIGMLIVWWFIYYFFMFPNVITIYRIAAGHSKSMVYFDKYRYRKSRGKLDIQLRNTGSILGIGGMTSSIPPGKVLNVTKGGKEFLTGIKVSEDEFIFPGLEFDPNKLLEPQRKDFTKEDGTPDEVAFTKAWNVWKEYIDKLNFQPMTSTDRSNLVNEIEDRKERQNQSWLALLNQYAGTLVLVIIVVIIFVFWNDITKPNLEMARTLVGVTQNQQLISQQNLDIIRSQAALYAQMTGKPLPASVYPPDRYNQQSATPPG